MHKHQKFLRSLAAILLAAAVLVGQCVGVAAAGISKAESSAQTASGAIAWRLAPTKYETEDTVVMGCLITDFISASSIAAGADCTSAAQRAIDLLYNAGGGTLFFPEGQYTFRGTLEVKKGVTLCGDWVSPEKSATVTGTVFKVYSGRGDENGTSFITMQPNTCVRNMSFWYPEQDASNIVAYPPTIITSAYNVWGADYMHVKNVTLVNSYIGIVSAVPANGQMPVCPTLRYVYGSPLKLGVDMDGIVDVGRFDYISFSPDYWVNSGLSGAPSASNTTYKNYIYNNGVGVALGRIDWSYLTYTDITGYNQGLRFRESTIDPGSAPNGQCYKLTMKNCKYGIYAASMSSCGEAVTSVDISGCEYGLYIERDSVNAEGLLQMMDITISAGNYAVYHDGYINLVMSEADINSGKVHLNNGVSTFTDCAFNTTGTHMSVGGDYMNAIISGCRFNGTMNISGSTEGKVAVDTGTVDIPSVDATPDFEYDYTCKPAREYLYVVNADASGNSDVTAVIQAALNEAGSQGGGVVFLAPGHYRINGTLNVPSGVELKGAVDIGRNPIQLGTIFEVYNGAGNANGTATVTLQANSGIRGIVFNQPAQTSYSNPTAYPYCVRGAGSDIYIINVSLRNVYNGVDLMTNRCDNHYVEYLAGIALKNDLKVGGGSRNGVVCNMQVNYGCLNNGNESKNGTWPNSPTDEAGKQAVQQWLHNNSEVLTIGDTESQMLYNNFSFSGRYGIRLVSQSGTGGNGLPDGWALGQGVDSGISAFCIDAIGTMPFINAQIVALKKDYVSTEYTNHIVVSSGCTGTVDMYNVACWGSAKGFVRAENGKLNLYNSNFFNFVDYFGYVQSAAKVKLINSMFHANGSQKLFDSNKDNVTLRNVFYTNSLADIDDYANAKHVYRRGATIVPQLGLRVQAEKYDTMVGMQVEGCEDGGQELGFIDTGDYATYTVTLTGGTYTMRVRGASPNTGSTVHLRDAAGNTLASVTIGQTGGWQVWDCFTSGEFTLPAGTQTLTLYIAQGGCNINWFELIGGEEASGDSDDSDDDSTVGSDMVTTVGSSTVRIEAEDYNAMSGIQTEGCGDADGGEDVGFTDKGDWLDYKVNVQTAGTYRMALRASSPYGGGLMDLQKDGTALAQVAVDNTGDWQAYQTFESGTFALSAGEQTLRLYVQNAGVNLNWFELTLVEAESDNAGDSGETEEPSTGSDTVTTVGSSTVRIEAEDYNAMYGVQVESCGDTDGGEDVGYTHQGDWLTYNINVQQAGTYRLQLRLASPYSTGSIYVEKGSTALSQCDMTATGGWQTYETFNAGTLELPAGEQTLRLYVQGGDFNINWLELTYDTYAAEKAGNPVIGTMFTADPSAHVWEKDGKIYMYASHDVFPSQGCDLMDGYHIFSSDNMVDWHDEGEILHSSDLDWGIDGFMWAPDAAYKDGTYYFYYPHPSADPWNSTWKVGVATSSDPAGNFVDQGYIKDLAGYSLIDPCVFQDDDGNNYIYIGGGATTVGGKLADDMMSVDGSMQPMEGLEDFHEGAWVFKRGDTYYFMYADNTSGENCMRYATSDSPLGPWTYRGVMLEGTGCDTTHGSVVQYKGNWYLFYHNCAISGNGTLRSVCIDRLYFNTDGSIQMVQQTTEGVSALGPVKGDNTGTTGESLSQYTETTTYGLDSATAGGGASKGGSSIDNLHISGSYAEFTGIDGGNGGKALLKVYYATPDGASAKVDTTGDTAGDGYYLGMQKTSSWSDYSGEGSCVVDLVAGKNNTIRLTGGMGGFNLAYITVSLVPGGTNTPDVEETPDTDTDTDTDVETPVVGNETTYYAARVGNNASLTGEGYVQNLHNANAYCEFDVQGTGSTATVKLVYAMADATATVGVSVNGTAQDDLTLTSTGGWGSYTGEATFTVQLNGGGNTIRFTGGRNGFNVAYVVVTLTADSTPTVPDTEETPDTTPDVEETPDTQPETPAVSTETTYYAARVGNNASLTGEGYVQNLHNANAYCEFDVQGTGSEATVKLVYAMADATATVGVSVNGTAQSDLTLTSTGGWGSYTGEVTFTVQLNGGSNIIRLTGGRNGFNVAYIVVTTTGSAAAETIHVEAEDYTAMYGIQTESCGDTDGGQDVGYTDNGDWLDYTVNVTAAGTYRLDLRASSPYGGGLVYLQFGGSTLTQVTVDNTGDWQAYQTFSGGTFRLEAGQQTIRLYVQNAGVNFNWLELVPA